LIERSGETLTITLKFLAFDEAPYVLQYVDRLERRRLEQTFQRTFLFLLLLMPSVNLLGWDRDRININVQRPQIGGFWFW
jgi:hypothetical protein